MNEDIFHDCPAAEAILNTYDPAFGEAIERKIEFERLAWPVAGEPTRWGWVAGNDEYSSAIRYCPWCGIDLYQIAVPKMEAE